MGYIAEQNGFSCIGWLPVFFFFFLSFSQLIWYPSVLLRHLVSITEHIFTFRTPGRVKERCMHVCTHLSSSVRTDEDIQENCKNSLSFCLSLPHSLSLPLFICSFFSLFPSLVLVHICHNYSSISFKRNHFILNIVLMN